MPIFRIFGMIDSRTLLETPTSSRTYNVSDGEYWHAGLVSSMTEHLIKTNDTNTLVEIKFNIDGLSISKSSKGQIWQILGQVELSKPFFVGIYYGSSKPELVESFCIYSLMNLESSLKIVMFWLK